MFAQVLQGLNKYRYLMPVCNSRGLVNPNKISLWGAWHYRRLKALPMFGGVVRFGSRVQLDAFCGDITVFLVPRMTFDDIVVVSIY